MAGEVELYKLLADRASRPVEVLRALIQRYGVEWFSWPYSVLARTLEKELRPAVEAAQAAAVDGDARGIPEWALHRSSALAAVALQDAFWEHWEHFYFLVQALNGDVADSRTHRQLTVGQMMLAVHTATQIRSELAHLSYVPPFAEEVARYVAAQALAGGVWYLPPPLAFAAPYAAGRRYRCLDCGNDSEVLFDDGLCDVCVHRFDTSRLGSWTPSPEAVAKGWGKHIEVYEKNPTAPVARRLKEVAGHPGRTLQQNPVDVCVDRLLAALAYAGYPLAEATA